MFDSLTELLKYFEDLRFSVEAHVEKKQESQRLSALCRSKKAIVTRLREELKKGAEHVKGLEQVRLGKSKMEFPNVTRPHELCRTAKTELPQWKPKTDFYFC